MKAIFTGVLLLIATAIFGFFGWQVPVDVSASGSGSTMFFGVDSVATVGYDPLVDIPFFPMPGAYGYFPLDDSLFPSYTMLGTDLRQPTQDTIAWDFMVAGGFGFAVEWDSANLPDSGSFAIGPYKTDSLPAFVVLEWTDMRFADSINVNLIGGRIIAVGAPVSAVREATVAKPTRNSIKIRPNPFNSACTIILPDGARDAVIYDLAGRSVARVFSDNGIVVWDGKSDCGDVLPDGVYYIKCTPDAFHARKLVILR